MVGMRWAIRGIGLLSTVILARLLAPEDFGLVAMAMVGIGLLEVFTHAGVDLALIRNREAEREHYDAAWTINVALGAALALVLLLGAPVAAAYFGDPRVTSVIRFLALRSFIGGFENVGVIDFRRDLAFDKEFRFEVYKKSIYLVVIIGLAAILRNYWALVGGMITSRIMGVTLSYRMHPYRPRPSLARVSEIWGFSRWLVAFRVGRYVNRRTDEFVVGGIFGANTMGSYHVGAEVATTPTDELVFPMSRGLFPVYSKLGNDPTALAHAFRNVLSVVSFLCVSMGVGMALVAHDMVVVVFGQKWIDAIPLVKWLAIFGVVAGIVGGFETLMTVTGRVRSLSLVTLGHSVLQLPVMWFAGIFLGIQGVAASRTLLVVAVAPVVIYLATRGTGVTVRWVASAIWTRLVAGALMAMAVLAVHPLLPEVPWLRLLCETATGAGVFATVTLALWRLQGRPEGPEKTVLDYLRRNLLGGGRRGAPTTDPPAPGPSSKG
jgi:O-antigen/teichoic acid export membrane protein